METLYNTLSSLKIKASIRYDDTIDQLHHFITVYLLTVFALLIGVKEYSLGQLDCWFTNMTMELTRQHVNTYCWTHKLYRYPNPYNHSQVPYALSPDHGGPVNSTILEHGDLGDINFYSWITVIFLCQAFMFKLPNLIWTECNEHSGTQIETMVTMIGSCSFETQEKKDTLFASVAEFLEKWLKINGKLCMKSRGERDTKPVEGKTINEKKDTMFAKLAEFLDTWLEFNRKPIWECGDGPESKETLPGNYLSTMYIIVKAMFLVNVVLQFFILTSFLEFDYWGYGIRVMQIFHESAEKIDNIHFPRVALCHFQVQNTGCWIQCLLTINMLLEKLFVVEWFWFLFLLILTVFNCIAWLAKILRTGRSVKFVTKYLSVPNEDGSSRLVISSPFCKGRQKVNDKTPIDFVQDYLGNDGVFILRIIATNTNDVVMLELLANVWKRYLNWVNPKYASKEELDKQDLAVENEQLTGIASCWVGL